jgi:hypothetical protein
MADTNILPWRGTTVPDAKLITGSFQAFASGTVPSNGTALIPAATTSGSGATVYSLFQGFGIASVTYNNMGNYTVVFDNSDFISQIVGASFEINDLTSAGNWVSGTWDMTTAGGPQLVLQIWNALGSKVDPASIAQVSWMFVVTASGVGYAYF